MCFTITVWPGLAKFRHFGTILKVLGKFLRVNLVFGKMLILLSPKLLKWFSHLVTLITNETIVSSTTRWSIPGLLLFICIFSIQLTAYKCSIKPLMVGFEPGFSGVGGNSCSKAQTVHAKVWRKYLDLKGFHEYKLTFAVQRHSPKSKCRSRFFQPQ